MGNNKLEKLKLELANKNAKLLLETKLAGIFETSSIKISNTVEDLEKLEVWSFITKKKYGIAPFCRIRSNEAALNQSIKTLFSNNLGSMIFGFHSSQIDSTFRFVVKKTMFIDKIQEFFISKSGFYNGLFYDEKDNFIIVFEQDEFIEVFMGRFIEDRVVFTPPMSPR